MVAKPFTIVQDIFKNDNTLVEIQEVDIDNVTLSMIEKLVEEQAAFIGLAPVYNSRCALVSIALASKSHSLIVRLGSRKHMKKSSREILNALLCDKMHRNVAFEMDSIAIALYLDCGLHITRGLDLLSVSRGTRGSIASILSVLGGELNVHKKAVMKLFEHEVSGTAPRNKELAMQAWAACHAGSLPSLASRMGTIREIDTSNINKEVCTSRLSPVIILSQVPASQSAIKGTPRPSALYKNEAHPC
jgi:hypothetical protein